MGPYQRSLADGFYGSFDEWFNENKDGDIDSAKDFVVKKMMQHIIPHGLPIPNEIDHDFDKLNLFSVNYTNYIPKSREMEQEAYDHIKLNYDEISYSGEVNEDFYLLANNEEYNQFNIKKLIKSILADEKQTILSEHAYRIYLLFEKLNKSPFLALKILSSFDSRISDKGEYSSFFKNEMKKIEDEIVYYDGFKSK